MVKSVFHSGLRPVKATAPYSTEASSNAEASALIGSAITTLIRVRSFLNSPVLRASS
ncbi:MAG: hypothetical protein IID33_13145 [Planctomycetes bacterium]|nr:hypothetical protein [Planctomycetota bacterium]